MSEKVDYRDYDTPTCEAETKEEQENCIYYKPVADPSIEPPHSFCGWREGLGYCGYEDSSSEAMCKKCTLQPQWISFKDRLPELDKYIVSVCDQDSDRYYMSRASDLITEEGLRFPVTHWLPLPGPPNKGAGCSR